MFEKAKEKLALDENGFILQGIQTWIVVAVTLVIFVIVIANILSATPLVTSGPMNTTQVTVNSMVGSSFNLIVIVLIVIAAVIILSVVTSLGGRANQ